MNPPSPQNRRVAPRVGVTRPAHTWWAAVVLSMVFSVSPTGAAAPVPQPQLEVPGGTAALGRVLGLEGDASPPRVVLAAIHVLWGSPGEPLVERRRADARVYIDALAAVSRAWESAGRRPATLRDLAGRLKGDGVLLLAAALGCVAEERGGRWLLTPVQTPSAERLSRLMTDAGLDVTAVVAGLNEGRPASLALATDSVPLPLPPSTLRAIMAPPDSAAGSLFTELMADRRGAMVYYGALALDDSMRAFVAAWPASVLKHDLRAAVFATMGRSLHVGDGRVQVPGGAAAAPLWEDVVGEAVTSPRAFAQSLLDRDDGRIALFYDALAHVRPDVVAWVLADGADPSARLDRFKRLLSASAAGLVGWQPRFRPFDRQQYDVPHVLMRLRVRPGARQPDGPMGRTFWTQAFASLDLPTGDAAATVVAADEPLDAAELAALLCVPNMAVRRDRVEAFFFAQRLFPNPTPQTLGQVLVAVRGFLRFRALALTLERIGITDPATFVSAMVAADRVSAADGDRAWVTVGQFQAAVAMIERAVFNRTLDTAAATAWLRLLAGVPLSPSRDYLGGVADWIDERLMAQGFATLTIPEFCDPDRPVEARVMAVMAGAVPWSPFADPARTPSIEWEGLLYRVDPARATLRRMVDVRAAQRGVSLDAVLAVHRAIRAVASVASVDNLAGPLGHLAETVAVLSAAADRDDEDARGSRPDLQRELAASRRGLGDLRGRPSRAALLGAMAPLRRATDWYLTRVLVSLVYAPHLGEPDSPALLGGDPSQGHDFGFAESRPDRRLPVMWSVPAERRDDHGRWGLVGSLLNLDVPLGRFSLRRVPSEIMPSPPMLTDVERQAFTEPLVLISPFAHTDAGRSTLLDALNAGRRRLRDATPETLDALARDAGLDEWRTQLVRWVAEHDRARLADWWSLGELVTVGLEGRPRPADFDAWGTSGLSADGNLACAWSADFPWTTLAGRKGTRLSAALVPDLGIAVAEALMSLQLPVRLSAGVLAVATQEYLETVRAVHDDDWLSLVVHAKRVIAGRIEDYVSALTIGGPLVPAETEPDYEPGR